MTASGHICEVFSSFQGEGGSVAGSCMGRRQVFIRFAGCNLASGSMGTKGCVYCDSPRAKHIPLPRARMEVSPGAGRFRLSDNPISASDLLAAADHLATPDLHSVSLTGGEPLWQAGFLEETLAGLKDRGRRTYLETNGSLPSVLARVSSYLDYACVDLKDKSARAATNWVELVELELESILMLQRAGVATFAKLVATSRTTAQGIETVSERLARLECPLVIQVVTPRGSAKAPTASQLAALSEAAAKHLHPDLLAVSYQMHRGIGLK